MKKKTWFAIGILSMTGFCLQVVLAQPQDDEAVDMSGISIIGNRELPKTLFIVPWKNSEVGIETDLTNNLDEGLRPLDREVFVRELNYYEFSRDLN